MEGPGGNSDLHRDRGSSSSSRRYRVQLSAANFIRSPISALLEYSGLLRPSSSSSNHESESLINRSSPHIHDSSPSSNGGEVSIRIIGASEQDHDRAEAGLPPATSTTGVNQPCPNDVSIQPVPVAVTSVITPLDGQEDPRSSERGAVGDGLSQFSGSSADAEAADGGGANNRDSSYQRYDIQQAARWIEQILPFSLLLLVVFIRQHLQGFFVTIWIAVVMFKSNDILRDRKSVV